MNASLPTGASAPTAGGSDDGSGGGAFPGYGPAPPDVGPASAGVLATVSRADHTHSTLEVADVAALALVDASAMNAGVPVFVQTLRAVFALRQSSQAAAALVRVAALGKAGYLWIRESLSPSWWNQTTWHINPATGSDENTGATALLPLATFAEYRRRHYARWLPGTETGSVTVNIAGGNLGAADYVSVFWTNGLRGGSQVLTVTGTPTVLATGVIAAATAQNRAAGQRNEIDAGFAWAAHVGRQVRLQATPTTQAVVMEDLGGTTCALGEQSVNGVLGAGFTAGQTIEVIGNTVIPGVHVAGPGAPDVINLIGVDVDGASWQVRHTGGAATFLQAFNSRFVATNGAQINCDNFRPLACAFVGPNSITCSGVWFSTLTTNVGLPTGGVILTNPYSRNHIASHCSQGPAFTISENSYATISGTGSGSIGLFGLGAGAVGHTINIGAHFACSSMWGDGNDATSVPIQRSVGSSWSKVAAGVIDFTGLVAQGVGLRLQTGAVGGDIDIPLAALPSAIGDGQQPVMFAKFSGVSGDAGAPTTTYLADTGILAGAGIGTPMQYPTSEKTIVRLRLGAVTGTGANPPTATLYKNGIATTMTCTLGAGAAAGANVVDSAHPIKFSDGDTFDVEITQPIAAEGDAVFTATLEALS